MTSSTSRNAVLKDLSIAPLVIGYGLCSSLLSIINKWAIQVFGYPSLLTALQYVTCVVTVILLGKLRILHHDPIRFRTMVGFFPAAFVFYMAIFTNTSLLKYANVDTFVVFRSSTPILVAIADTVFRKQPWPNTASLLSLLLILFGAVGYVATDSQFTVTAYTWAFAYLAVITFEMVYVKHIVTHLGLNTWGYVLYNNLLSLMLFPACWWLTGEFRASRDADHTTWGQSNVIVPVLLSCMFGLAISFFGFACRKSISATAFTVVGVTNKLLTIIINVLIWDKHASNIGIMFLLLTVVGGVAYQQSVSKGSGFATPQGKVKLKAISQDEEIGESTPSKDRDGKVVYSSEKHTA